MPQAETCSFCSGKQPDLGPSRKSHHRTCSFAVRPRCDMCGLVRDRDHDCQSPLTLLCRRHHCDPVRTAWACEMTGPAEASVVTYESGVGASGSCEGHAWVSLRGRVPETPGLELRLLCPRLASRCVVLSGFLSLPETPFPSCRRRGLQPQQHGATLPLARPF